MRGETGYTTDRLRQGVFGVNRMLVAIKVAVVAMAEMILTTTSQAVGMLLTTSLLPTFLPTPLLLLVMATAMLQTTTLVAEAEAEAHEAEVQEAEAKAEAEAH
jgi:hypothetical protein